MPFTLVRGTFRPAAGLPDGDSVRFEPDNAGLMRSVPGVRMRAGAATVQLRYEGIDALEKHAIQPHAANARDENLRLLGTAGTADAEGARGHILTRGGDQKAGRPVCFVYAGEPEEGDGASVFLEPDRVRDSVNYKLLAAGLAYPLYYETLFKELRDELTAAHLAARAAGAGYIGLDRSAAGVRYPGPHGLGTIPPVFPKLFRRLDDWNGPDLRGFLAWLENNDDERVHTIADNRFIGFQDALQVSGDTVRLLYAPHEMVFRPKPFGPPLE